MDAYPAYEQFPIIFADHPTKALALSAASTSADKMNIQQGEHLGLHSSNSVRKKKKKNNRTQKQQQLRSHTTQIVVLP